MKKFIVIIGPQGSGKSTKAHSIVGKQSYRGLGYRDFISLNFLRYLPIDLQFLVMDDLLLRNLELVFSFFQSDLIKIRDHRSGSKDYTSPSIIVIVQCTIDELPQTPAFINGTTIIDLTPVIDQTHNSDVPRFECLSCSNLQDHGGECEVCTSYSVGQIKD